MGRYKEGNDIAGKKEQIKMLRAGRVLYVVQYTSLRGAVAKKDRQAKRHISSAVREAMNFRTSVQKLWLILESTFDPSRDLFVTLTYRDVDLPKRKEDADRKLSYFLRDLRENRSANGAETVYVRVTEGWHSDGRFHHHILINGTGQDYTLIRKLWRWGDEVEILPYYCKDHWTHAEYFTKETKERGRRRVGERMWRASRNVKRPIISYEEAPPGSLLAAPAGAFVEEKDTKDNSFGRYQYLRCRLSETHN